MSDTEVARTVRRVLATLLDDGDTVRVEVEQGVVYLEGIATNAGQKHKIQQLVTRVPGVRRVIDCLSLEHIAKLETNFSAIPFGPAIAYLRSPHLRPGS